MLVIHALNATLAMGIVGVLAVVFRVLLIFPSLGPTAYLLFAHPHEDQAQPKNAFLAHGFGAPVGWDAFTVIQHGPGGQHAASSFDMLQAGGAMPFALMAAAVSIGLTLAIMVATGTDHSPACSTTLIFSLRLFQHLWQVGVLLAGVLLLLVCRQMVKRLGRRVPGQ